jgi:hypothetical protein
MGKFPEQAENIIRDETCRIDTPPNKVKNGIQCIIKQKLQI